VAVDPGKVSGIAVLAEHELPLTELAVPRAPATAELDHRETVTYLRRLIGRANLRADEPISLDIVVEKFTISDRTVKTKQDHTALDIIGWLRSEYTTAPTDAMWDLYEQTPVQAKKFSTDAKLHQLGWYRRTEGGHANDASRHLLRHLCSSYIHLARPLLEVVK
jgi:hypothetical protein